MKTTNSFATKRALLAVGVALFVAGGAGCSLILDFDRTKIQEGGDSSTDAPVGDTGSDTGTDAPNDASDASDGSDGAGDSGDSGDGSDDAGDAD